MPALRSANEADDARDVGLGPAAGIRPAWSARRSRDRGRAARCARTDSGSASRRCAARSRRRRNGRPASAALTARTCATTRRNPTDHPRAGRHSRCRRACPRCRGRGCPPPRSRRRAPPAPPTAHGWCRRSIRRSHGPRSPRGPSPGSTGHSGGSRARCRPAPETARSRARCCISTVPRAAEIDCSSGGPRQGRGDQGGDQQSQRAGGTQGPSQEASGSHAAGELNMGLASMIWSI